MTRRNKCDFCRTAKVKCDENLPSCSACVRRGKECTRTYDLTKKDTRFVQVMGQVVAGSVGLSSTRAKKVIVPSTTSNLSSSRSRKTGTIIPITTSDELALFFPNSERDSLLARWTSMCKDLEYTSLTTSADSCFCKHWTIYILRFIGTSSALDDAAQCYLHCKLLITNPTESNYLALETSKLKAVRSVRSALDRRGSRHVQISLIIAVQLLYLVEALVLHSHSTMVTHVRGLIGLLDEHKKSPGTSDNDEHQMSSGIYISSYCSGLIPALLKGEDHDLDSQCLLSGLPIITSQSTLQAWQSMAQSFATIPRLARLIRHLQVSPKNTKVETEAIDLAQRLSVTTINPTFFPEATSLGHLKVDATTILEIADIVPTSYRFNSEVVMGLLTMYWMSRLLICGLVSKLISIIPSPSRFFSISAVEAEDTCIATEVLMIVQHVFTESAETDSSTKRIKQLQLLSVLQIAFGAWYRMEMRITAPMDEGSEEMQRANTMKWLCLDLGNHLLRDMRLPLMEMGEAEMVSEMFAGGPLVQCDLPEEQVLESIV